MIAEGALRAGQPPHASQVDVLQVFKVRISCVEDDAAEA